MTQGENIQGHEREREISGHKSVAEMRISFCKELTNLPNK
jgi:hypothetical protein